MTPDNHPFNRPYSSGNKVERPTKSDLERGRKRRIIETIEEARELGEELMEYPWEDE